MKSHRNVCHAIAPDYTEYTGLQGKVQTGCPNTPVYRSPYCIAHKPVISVQKGAEKPVGLIIEKNSKVMRNSTFYQVIYRQNTIFMHMYIRICNIMHMYGGTFVDTAPVQKIHYTFFIQIIGCMARKVFN